MRKLTIIAFALAAAVLLAACGSGHATQTVAATPTATTAARAPARGTTTDANACQSAQSAMLKLTNDARVNEPRNPHWFNAGRSSADATRLAGALGQLRPRAGAELPQLGQQIGAVESWESDDATLAELAPGKPPIAQLGAVFLDICGAK